MDVEKKISDAIQNHELRYHKRNGRFVPPTVAAVAKYAGQGFDAEGFVDFYESKGWKVGNQKMRSWKAAVRTWQKRNCKSNKTKLYPIKGKHCSKCPMPAVYKGGHDFDFYYCAEHMPAKVKEKYCG